MECRESAIAAAIAGVVLLFTTLATSSIATPENVLAYEKNQAVFQTSACGNDFFPTNIGCESADSQIQGDENGAALTAQQTFPEVEPINQKGILDRN